MVGMRSAAFLSFTLLLLQGCAGGKAEYRPPRETQAEEWNTKLPAASASADELAGWWKRFNDPVLSGLVARAAEGNLDLKIAHARLMEARARANVTKSQESARVDASGGASRSRSAEDMGSGSVSSRYNAGFDASWEIDLFGVNSRHTEAAYADMQAQEEALRDVLTTLCAEVTRNYIQLRYSQVKLGVAQRALEAQENIYSLAKSAFVAGESGAEEADAAEKSLETKRAFVSALEAEIEETQNRLCVLLGKKAGSLHAELAAARQIPALSGEMSVAAPAEVLRRRPDVRRAERELAAQVQRRGAAEAEIYPVFSLRGFLGFESFSSTRLFLTRNRAWSIIPGVEWNIFDAGAVRQNIKAQSALEEQALGNYNLTVLKALEDVENSLLSFAKEKERLHSLRNAEKIAQNSLMLAQSRFESGSSDMKEILDARLSALSAREEVAGSETSLALDIVSLYKALGGGWKMIDSTDRQAVKNE